MLKETRVPVLHSFTQVYVLIIFQKLYFWCFHVMTAIHIFLNKITFKKIDHKNSYMSVLYCVFGVFSQFFQFVLCYIHCFPKKNPLEWEKLFLETIPAQFLNTSRSRSLLYDKNDGLTVMCNGVVSGECDDSQPKALTCRCWGEVRGWLAPDQSKQESLLAAWAGLIHSEHIPRSEREIKIQIFPMFYTHISSCMHMLFVC